MNNNKNSVHSVILENAVVAPGVVANTQFVIPNNNRTSKLKSLYFDIQIRNAAVPNELLPLEENITQQFALAMYNLPANYIFTKIVEAVNPPAALLANGARVTLFRPQQVFFDSFYIRNNLLMILEYENRDLLITYSVTGSIIIELETTDLT